MSPETKEIGVVVREAERWNRRLSITVPAERVQRVRSLVTSQLTRNARLPGFRKGKLPARVVEQRFGPAIERETLDRTVQDAYREALDAEGLIPISQGKIDNIQYEQGTDLTFEVAFEVRPEIEIERLSGFTVQRPSEAVGEDETEAVIERLRDEQAVWRPLEADTPLDYGDRVTVEITALDEDDDAEPRTYRFVLGEQQAIPAVEEAITTLTPGAENEFHVRFPDDFADEERRGVEQHLRIKVLDAHRKELPAIDDELARSVGDFDDLAALRERILEDLRGDAGRRAENEVRARLLDFVIDANRFDVPDSMVERYLDSFVGEVETDEEGNRRELTREEEERLSRMREGLRPQAELQLKRILVIDRIADREGLRATQDEIDTRVEAIAERHEHSPSEVWIQLEKSGQLDALEREITEDKVFEHLKSLNRIENVE